MRCAACRHDNPAASHFCEHCGERLGLRCGACGERMSATAIFCGQCGARQKAAPAAGSSPPPSGDEAPAPSEYRHLTVLFCDLVGSTALSERVDTEELRDLMRVYQRECREALEAYGGYIAQYRGDGVLAYFGFPQAHEDDAERAVRGALELQRRLRQELAPWRGEARIGIHSGEVIVGDMGNETLAHGSAMNLAARIEAIAEPGGVAISDATQTLTSGVFVTRELGEHDLKGIHDPVRIYGVDRVLGGRRRGPDAARPLVNRVRELELLTERFELAAEGHGQVVLVSGEAGIGKSRLTLALREAIANRPHVWVDMQCSPFTSGSALRPVVDLFRERVSRNENEPPERRSELLAEGIEETPGLDPQRVLPYLYALLGLPAPEGYALPAITPEVQRERTMEALCAVVDAISRQLVLIMEIEDLHWADPSTLEYLDRLVSRAPTLRLLLLGTARPEFELPWQRSHVETLQLARLPRRHALDLIDSVKGERSLPSVVVDQIADRADGIPLFVEALARAVLDPDRRAGEHGAEPRLAIPTTLQGSLMEQLDRLGSAKRVAQLGATVGHEFSYELIEKVGEISPVALRTGLGRLVEAEVLHERGVAPASNYVFRHILLRDTAYNSQLRSERRRIHARVAEVLEHDFAERCAAEPWILAQHCEAAGLHSAAAASYQQAAVLAAARYANQEALDYGAAVLGQLSALPESAERWERELAARLTMVSPLVAKRGLAHAEVEGLHEQIAELCEARLEGSQALPGLLALSRYHARRGDPRQSSAVGESILAIARDVRLPILEVVAGLIVGSGYITIAEASRAIARLERTVEQASSIDLPPASTPLEPELLSFILAVTGVALASGGYPDRAAARAKQARERALEQKHEPTLIHIMALSTVTFYLLEDYETTIAWGEEVLELCRDRGFDGPAAEARTNLGWARVALGDPAGLEDVEAGLAHAFDSGFRGGLCEYLQAAADANRLAGRTQRAHELLDRSHEVYAGTGEAICFEGRGRRTRAMTHLAEGAPDKAEAEFHRALEVLNRYGARLECLRTATELLRLARGRPDEEAARERLATAYAQFEGEGEYRAVRAARLLLEESADAT